MERKYVRNRDSKRNDVTELIQVGFPPSLPVQTTENDVLMRATIIEGVSDGFIFLGIAAFIFYIIYTRTRKCKSATVNATHPTDPNAVIEPAFCAARHHAVVMTTEGKYYQYDAERSVWSETNKPNDPIPSPTPKPTAFPRPPPGPNPTPTPSSGPQPKPTPAPNPTSTPQPKPPPGPNPTSTPQPGPTRLVQTEFQNPSTEESNMKSDPDMSLETFLVDCRTKKGIGILTIGGCQCFNKDNSQTIEAVNKVHNGQNANITSDLQNYMKTVYSQSDVLAKSSTTDGFNFLYNDMKFDENSKIIQSNGDGTLYTVKKPKAFDSAYAEVMFVGSVDFKKKFSGTWFDAAIGSGWFLYLGPSMIAKNSREAVEQLHIPSATHSSWFSNGTLTDEGRTGLVWAVGLHGFKSLQLLEEPQDQKPETRFYVVKICDLETSAFFLSRRSFGKFGKFHQVGTLLNSTLKNGFSSQSFPLSNETNLMQNSFGKCKKLMFDRKLSIGFFEDGVKGCEIAKQKDQNEKIEVKCMNRVQDAICRPIPTSAKTVEKLRAYYTCVYGNPDVWQKQSEQDLTNRFTKLDEIRFMDILKQSGLEGTFVNTDKYQGFSRKNRVPVTQWNTFDAKFRFWGHIFRPVEQLEYVEVFSMDDEEAAHFFEYDGATFPGSTFRFARGSGFFIYMGVTVCAQHQPDAMKALDYKFVENSDTAEKQLWSSMIAKGVETVCYPQKFENDFHFPLIFKCCSKPCANIMVMQTHPFDPLVNKVSTDFYVTDKFSSFSNQIGQNCIVREQFDASKAVLCKFKGADTCADLKLGNNEKAVCKSALES
jgi:hypothetical protein